MESTVIVPNAIALETRHLWWNIESPIAKPLFYLLIFAATGVFLYGLFQKLKPIFAAKALKNDDRFDNLWSRINYLLNYAFLQKKIASQRTPGLAHIAVVLGFMTLWIVTNIVGFQDHSSVYFFQGMFYKLVSFAAEIGGLLLFGGILSFTLRRYVFTTKRLDHTQADWMQPLFLFALVITGFLVEGLRIAGTRVEEDFSFIGNALAQVFQFMTEKDLHNTHFTLWWLHAMFTAAFIALLPHSKFIHIFTAPLPIFFRSKRERGQLATPFKLTDMLEAEEKGIEINEEDFNAGVFEYSDFSWKSLLDSEACTACGRCHVVCPAQNTDKPLSPKHLFLDIKKLSQQNNSKSEEETDVYEFISPDVLWSCTSCNACVEECPIFIEHVDTIVDMRRGLLAMNKAPANLQATLKNIRTKTNPWGLAANEREKWLDSLKDEHGLELKVLSRAEESFEYLYWVGSPGAYDSRNIDVSKANSRLFKAAGLDFAILGNEEKSSGDLARRAGDEAMFQEIVIENIEIFKAFGVKKIITQCPHVYNTFKNEYPEFGLIGVEIFHHSEILASLIQESKLVPKNNVSQSITYHDPCYLGRYNRVFDPPRFILESIPGLEIKQVAHEKEKSTCCGGGGAQIWYEMPGSQINSMRFDELNEHKPDKISVACPYCSIMIDSASKTVFQGTHVPEIEDVAITLAASVF
ncbi:MAG: 4Fe-4S dicluster domain-containing protein [Candidatus Caenarcaniphilales bacterium]|nr:4Fe-4S dicluster domain-containing protein [Candidatus Caenarcaniphilales bacterium]